MVSFVNWGQLRRVGPGPADAGRTAGQRHQLLLTAGILAEVWCVLARALTFTALVLTIIGAWNDSQSNALFWYCMYF